MDLPAWKYWEILGEYWGGLPFPSPGDLPDLEIEPGSPALQVECLPTEPPGKLINFAVEQLTRHCKATTLQ